MPLREKLIIRPESLDYARRGYRPGRDAVRAVLGPHARAFLGGYNAVITAGRPAQALRDMTIPAGERGFAVEGAAMATVLLDLLSVARGRRTRQLLEMEGERYRHLIHFGAGFAFGRLRWRGWMGLGALDPMLRWLAFDGTGFSVAALGDDQQVRALAEHRFRCDTRCHVRHQGTGRALWFIESAEPARIAERISTFPAHHHGDLWSGVAFAATLAGGGTPADVDLLTGLAGADWPHLAQGAAFAAEVCRQAGHSQDSAESVVRTLTGVPLAEAAAWSVEARDSVRTPDATVEQHQSWRSGIRTLATSARNV